MFDSSCAKGPSSSSASLLRARSAMCPTAVLSSAMTFTVSEKRGQNGLSSLMIFSNPTELREAVPRGKRLLGLDVGTKTIGLALSDTRQIIATPLETIRRRRFREDMTRLFALVDSHGVGGLVIGLPLTLA